MTRILIADDDPNIRELVRVFLSKEGFDTIEAVDGVHALEQMENTKIDLAIVDVMMPRMDGFQLCEELRESYDMPIILLTAKGETAHKVKGFGQGADDYIVKPFVAVELMLRVKALLKRYRITTSQTVQIGELILDRSTYEVTWREERVTLPMKEFELLFRLGSYAGKSFTRGALIEAIWGMQYEGDDRTVDVHIKRIRERYPEHEVGFRIVAIRGLGYRLEEIK
ncbi:response regulator transcription factor [Paenibacillus roseipurpureus]|uniref:Heme response regulator HssR n=1 Tax=Paenibacillus roseopurpureus TaxID=2918901 RepID=A0AA96LN06_9BACL|nr:response regulator transcription factor [Paenibacillus sp. MBLB1832]WNR44048.1 response regulator transcription factor [Paenibacillus sp. MBLB1832]